MGCLHHLVSVLRVGVLLFVLGGCASVKPERWSDVHPAAMHVIAVDHLGRSIDPADPGAFDHVETGAQLQARIDQMSDAIERWAGMNGKEYRDILIFVHGGMNDPIGALNHAAEQVAPMMEDGYYPIFIIWNSKLESSYGEHLAHVRQGQFYKNGGWAAPVFFLSDMGRALFRAPIVWGRQIDNDASRIGANFSAWVHEDPTLALLDDYQRSAIGTGSAQDVDEITDGPTHVSIPSINEFSNGQTGDSNSESGKQVLAYALTVPLKFVSSPLLDSTGSAAWHNMYRRALILFDGEQSFELANIASKRQAIAVLKQSADHRGPLTRLMGMLREKAPTTDRKTMNPTTEPVVAGADSRAFRITLIGHSMGSIVLNEFVRRADDVDFARIVYMAAACSVRDFQESVQRYMQGHAQTRFYNLSLHPANELREVEGYEVPPRGSLLVWIDDMFADPHTPTDRTLGRWDNAVDLAYLLPGELRGRVRMKAFGMDAGDSRFKPGLQMPQKHGDFTACDYWVKSFWLPDPPRRAYDKFEKSREQIMIREATPLPAAIHQKGE